MFAPVVDGQWLEGHREEVVLADVRWYPDGRPGIDEYRHGHIPGAVFVDLDRDLAGDPGTGHGRHPLPEPGQFAQSMSALGIGDESIVVAYDDEGGVIAARLAWMLRATGRQAAILNGGIGAYTGPLENAAPPRIPAKFTAHPWPGNLLAGPADLDDPSIVLIDARNPDRFRGETEPIDSKAGHIPGALNVACRANLDSRGLLLPESDLAERFAAAGVTPGTRVVSYCGSGVTACHNLLVMEHCGLGVGRLYPGSWAEYSAMEGNPVATGED